LRQRTNAVETLISAEIGNHAALTAPQERKGPLLAQPGATRWLDPDDLAAVIGECLAHLGADPIGRQIDNPQLRQRAPSPRESHALPPQRPAARLRRSPPFCKHNFKSGPGRRYACGNSINEW